MRHLGDLADAPCDRVTFRELDRYLKKRLAERHENTAERERITLMQFYKWVVMQKHLTESPAADLARIVGGRGGREGAEPVEQLGVGQHFGQDRLDGLLDGPRDRLIEGVGQAVEDLVQPVDLVGQAGRRAEREGPLTPRPGRR